MHDFTIHVRVFPRVWGLTDSLRLFFFFYVQANNSITYASLDHDKYKQFDGFDI